MSGHSGTVRATRNCGSQSPVVKFEERQTPTIRRSTLQQTERKENVEAMGNNNSAPRLNIDGVALVRRQDIVQKVGHGAKSCCNVKTTGIGPKQRAFAPHLGNGCRSHHMRRRCCRMKLLREAPWAIGMKKLLTRELQQSKPTKNFTTHPFRNECYEETRTLASTDCS